MSTAVATIAEAPPELPHNVEAEAALLGALMVDNRLVEHIADKLKAEHFYEALHGRIYTAIMRECSLNRVANPITLRPYFADDPAMKEVGGAAYLAQLTGSGAAVIGARDFARQIHELAMRRELIGRLGDVLETARSLSLESDGGTKTFAELLTEAEAAVAVVGEDNDDGTVEVTVAQAADMAMQAAEAEAAHVRCGIDPVDAALGPLFMRDLTIVAGRPGMGKSVLASNYGRGASQRGEGVLLISLEMGAEQIGARVLSEMTFDFSGKGVPLSAVLARHKERAQIRRLFEVRDELEKLPFAIVDIGGCTPAKLNTLIRRWKRRFAAKGVRLRLVIVDYLQLMVPDFRVRDRVEAITYISQGLKRAAKTNDVHIMALSQLSRAVEQREDKRPRLSDLRDSGSIEQDADNVLFLFRPEYYLMESEPQLGHDDRPQWEALMDACRHKLECIVPKRRMGEPGKAFAEFHGAFQAVREARQ
jgi:replicative DNA helicase